MPKNKKQNPGSGRGNKGQATISDDSRPSCHKCGGFMKSMGKRDWRCTECGATRAKKKNREMLEEAGFYNQLGYDPISSKAHAKFLRSAFRKGTKRFLVTSAQNNTYADKDFLQSIHNYCIENDAELVVIPVHYRNMNAFVNSEDKSKFFDPAIEEYIVGEEVILGGVKIKADVPIVAPAVNPLSGLHDVGGDFDCIYGHAQHARIQVGAPADRQPKRLFTTGSITKKNYSNSKQGGKADFHHVMGAVVLEVDKKAAFIRQINSDSKGRFYDLDKHYTPDGVSEGHRIDVLTTGDEHVKFNAVADVTYLNDDSICSVLQPKYICRHDLFDAYSVSHHHIASPLVQFRKHHTGDGCARSELDECVAFLENTTPADSTNLIVPSNHIDHLEKWLNRADANKDHQNALLISELQHQMRVNALEGKTTDPFRIYVEPKIKCKTKWLDRNEPWRRRGVDHSQHGDVGINGSRGSAVGLSKAVHKMTIGHSHSPAIMRGVYQVGSSTGRLEYERGYSTHSQTHCVQYVNGKRTLIDIIDGRWRL